MTKTEQPSIVPIVKSDVEEARIVTTIMMALAHIIQKAEEDAVKTESEDKINSFRKFATQAIHCILAVIASYSIQTYLEGNVSQAKKIRGFALFTFLRCMNESLYDDLKIPGLKKSPKEVLTYFMNKNLEDDLDPDSKKDLKKILDDVKDSMDELKKQSEKNEDSETSEKKPKKKKKNEE